jgi:hypothetical protein
MNDGGPAYPQPAIDNQGRVDYALEMGWGGMTLRDYFAAQAIAGLLVHAVEPYGVYAEALAAAAYGMADAMIAQRGKI